MTHWEYEGALDKGGGSAKGTKKKGGATFRQTVQQLRMVHACSDVLNSRKEGPGHRRKARLAPLSTEIRVTTCRANAVPTGIAWPWAWDHQYPILAGETQGAGLRPSQLLFLPKCN